MHDLAFFFSFGCAFFYTLSCELYIWDAFVMAVDSIDIEAKA